ncbi:MAG: hypothetical protein R2822_27375 [Spirosomataceae bacterium]
MAQMMLDRSSETFEDQSLNEIDYTDFVTATDLSNAVKVEKSERANQLAIISGRTPEMELKIGNLISVTDPIYENGSVIDTIDYGTFVVTTLNHYIDSSGVYQAHFEGIPQDRYATCQLPYHTPQSLSQIGIVRDTADPLELGRVKVQFWWQGRQQLNQTN